jgi:hypothetical protein
VPSSEGEWYTTAARRCLEWPIYDLADAADALADVRYAIYSAPGAAPVTRSIAAWVVEGDLSLGGPQVSIGLVRITLPCDLVTARW